MRVCLSAVVVRSGRWGNLRRRRRGWDISVVVVGVVLFYGDGRERRKVGQGEVKEEDCFIISYYSCRYDR